MKHKYFIQFSCVLQNIHNHDSNDQNEVHCLTKKNTRSKDQGTKVVKSSDSYAKG